MKIVIKISFSQFHELMGIFGSVDLGYSVHVVREMRAGRTILSKVSVRLQKKYIEAKQQQDLFNQKKKIRLSFEYYEAHHLEKLLEVFDTFSKSDDVYFENTIRTIRAELNAKLA